MNSILSVACFAAVLALSSGHMCLLYPHQRGSMEGLNKPGSNDCILLNAICGDRPAETPVMTLKSGMNVTVILQKNLDHWVKATPGYFALSIMVGPVFKEIARVQDMGEASLHLYSLTGMIPTGLIAGQYILQATYVTNNPGAPKAFYQCADVQINE